MRRDSDRGRTEASPTLPNALLVFVLLLLLAWGIAGLYPPQESASLGTTDTAMGADIVAPKPIGSILTGAE